MKKIVILIPERDHKVSGIGTALVAEIHTSKKYKFLTGGFVKLEVDFFKYLRRVCKDMGWKVRMYKGEKKTIKKAS